MPLADIVDIVEGTIIKRRAIGKSHGVVLLRKRSSSASSPREVAELPTSIATRRATSA